MPRNGMVVLGRVDGLRELGYCEAERLFVLDGRPCALADVRAWDRQGRVAWRFLEQRDWMRRLPRGPFEEALAAAREHAYEALPSAERLDKELRAHARKDASYLHGRIVEEEAAPALAEAPEEDGE